MIDKIEPQFIGYIYCVENLLNKKKYIGQTIRTIEERFSQHKRDSKYKKTRLYNSFKKYGCDSFVIYEIEKIISNGEINLRQQLNEREIFYIAKYKSKMPYRYNMTIGGDTCAYVQCKEVAQIDKYGNVISVYESISDANIKTGISDGQICDVANGNWHTAHGYYWKYLSDIKIVNNKVEGWENQFKYVVQYSTDGILINIFDSLKDASNNTGLNQEYIGQCCCGHRVFVGSYRWMYANLNEEIAINISAYKDPRYKPIQQFDVNGNLISVYNSLTEAANYTGFCISGITQCCKGRQKTCNGYKWSYASDEVA